MVRQGNTAAESCWDDDSIDSDEKCEKYLQRRKAEAESAAEADEDESDVDDDEDTEDEDSEEAAEENDAITARGTESDDDDDPEEDDDETDDDSEEEASTSRGKKMAKKKADGSKTKADYIREVIAAKQAAGAEMRPRDIIAALEKKGVEVNASQVSITLRAMGVPPTRKGAGGRPKTAKPAAVAEADGEQPRATLKRRAEAGAETELAAHVEAAADFMRDVGGYDRAVKLLNLCNKVQQRS